MGLTDEVPWLGEWPRHPYAIRPCSAVGEVISLRIVEVEKVVKVLGRRVGQMIVCHKGNGLMA